MQVYGHFHSFNSPVSSTIARSGMSSIHYKFRALKDYDTYTFEGAGVPVWELKQEIIAAKKLNRANDFDLIISNAQTNQGTYTFNMKY